MSNSGKGCKDKICAPEAAFSVCRWYSRVKSRSEPLGRLSRAPPAPQRVGPTPNGRRRLPRKRAKTAPLAASTLSKLRPRSHNCVFPRPERPSRSRQSPSQPRKRPSLPHASASPVRDPRSRPNKRVSQPRKPPSRSRNRLSQSRKAPFAPRKRRSRSRKTSSSSHKCGSPSRNPVSRSRSAVSRSCLMSAMPSRPSHRLAFRADRTISS